MPVKGTSLASYRPMIQGNQGVLYASHHAAAVAGLGILQRGGNATDAGVAIGLALNVVNVQDCGFLGLAPIVLYAADRKEVTTIDGVGVWPKAASLEYFQRHHEGKVPTGILRAVTPGAVGAWFMALELYGTMSFEEVSRPAIDLAKGGYAAFRYMVDKAKATPDRYRAWPSNAEVLLPDGRPPEIGQTLYQKDFAATLEQLVAVEQAQRSLGREGALRAARDVVYKGDLAEKIVAFCQEAGGLLTREDLAENPPRQEPSAKATYRGFEMHACGPWCQGPVLPQALKMLEGFDLRSMGHNSSAYIHTVVEALDLAFADREQYIGDPAQVDVPMDELLSEEYLRERRTLIDPDHAWQATPPPGDPRGRRATLAGMPQSPRQATTAGAGDGAGTCAFGVIDRDGNMFSSIPSEGAQSGIIVPGTGMVLCLRGMQSKNEPGHPAALAPWKRPRITPAPALALKDGAPAMVLGGYGGDHIPQGMLQLFLNIVEFGLDPQEAVEEPRFYTYNFPSTGLASNYEPGTMRAEGRILQEVLAELRQRGHKVEHYPDWWEGACMYGAVTRDPQTGLLRGGADPRGDAFAIGY